MASLLFLVEASGGEKELGVTSLFCDFFIYFFDQLIALPLRDERKAIRCSCRRLKNKTLNMNKEAEDSSRYPGNSNSHL